MESATPATGRPLWARPLPRLASRGHPGRRAAVQVQRCEGEGSNGAKKVLIIGGTGRVGSSTARALTKAGVEVVVASRSSDSYSKMIARSPELSGAQFVRLDIRNTADIKSALCDVDLVIHAAGPFQQQEGCNVLEAAIQECTAYMDVCDDTSYSQRAKALHADAAAAGVPAIITCGIYPGVSNVIAAHIAARSLGEADKDGNYTEPSSDAPALSRLRYSYYTAGSGGVGNTLLVTSFMLTGEPVTAYKDGQKVVVEPLSQPTTIDFGPVVGRKGAYLWNLPEVASAHNCMGVPNVSARFGTSPQVWNWVMWLMARLVPKDVLQDREAMSVLANISEPMIRLVDLFVGETVAMRVDAELEGGKAASGLFVHPKLSESVGACVGAFAQCMLRGDTKPGVWFPEEKGALRNRRDLLALASEGCQVLVVNQPPWVIEQEPKQLGLGIYM